MIYSNTCIVNIYSLYREFVQSLVKAALVEGVGGGGKAWEDKARVPMAVEGGVTPVDVLFIKEAFIKFSKYIKMIHGYENVLSDSA